MDDLELALDRSDFYAARGERPASIELPDLARVLRAIERLNLLARFEIRLLNDPAASFAASPAPAREWEHGMRLDERSLDKGGAVRDITTWRDPDDTPAGEETRVTGSVPFKMILADRTAALIPLQPGAKTLHGGALLVRDPAVLDVLHATHAALWAALAPRGPADDAPPELQPVLRELLAGTPDVVAARRVGLSPRTYSRRVAALTELLGATTRAQIGAAAAARGWL